MLRRRRAGRVPPADQAVAFYPRLLAALRRWAGLVPRGHQTPAEFARSAGELLRVSQATRDHAAVPDEAAVLYYRVRYGARPLGVAERADLDRRLDRLESALGAGSPRPSSAVG
jgi:hypothetical protein